MINNYIQSITDSLVSSEFTGPHVAIDLFDHLSPRLGTLLPPLEVARQSSPRRRRYPVKVKPLGSQVDHVNLDTFGRHSGALQPKSDSNCPQKEKAFAGRTAPRRPLSVWCAVDCPGGGLRSITPQFHFCISCEGLSIFHREGGVKRREFHAQATVMSNLNWTRPSWIPSPT